MCSLGGVIYSQYWNLRTRSTAEINTTYGKDLMVVARALLTTLGLNSRSTQPTIQVAMWNDGLDVDAQQTVLDTFAKAEKIARAGYDPDAA